MIRHGTRWISVLTKVLCFQFVQQVGITVETEDHGIRPWCSDFCPMSTDLGASHWCQVSGHHTVITCQLFRSLLRKLCSTLSLWYYSSWNLNEVNYGIIWNLKNVHTIFLGGIDCWSSGTTWPTGDRKQSKNNNDALQLLVSNTPQLVISSGNIINVLDPQWHETYSLLNNV